MRLMEALQICKGEIVSFVGAGGKTTAMYRLGRELADQGWRVVTTTTTMIRPPSLEQTEALIVESDPARALRLAREALIHSSPITLAARRLVADDKLKGIDADWAGALAGIADAVIVEADGARGLSLKAPAAHEPVLPSETTLLVPVVGIDAVGCRLSEEAVHRPDLVAGLTGQTRGELISTVTLARVLVDPQGGLKGAPASARVAPLINKVHDEPTLAAAREVARSVKGHAALDRVLIGAVAAGAPIVECWRRVSAIVLAAGASQRFGRPKQLLPVDGKTMIEHVLRTVRETSVDEVVVVLGHLAAQMVKHVPGWCRTVLNEDWDAGISSSIRVGLQAIERPVAPSGGRNSVAPHQWPGTAQAALFVLADQPHIKSADIEAILQAYYGTTKPIVIPAYQGQRGNPILFDRRLFPALKRLRGDVGGRDVVARFPDQVLSVEVPSWGIFSDIDTPADYERFLRENERTESIHDHKGGAGPSA